MKTCFVYILTNPYRTVLYIGITNDLCRRLLEHKAARAERQSFTGQYNVRHLVYFEQFDGPMEAIRREKELKGWRRARKDALIATQNPDWEFLEGEVCG